jgi:hypothetical protein
VLNQADRTSSMLTPSSGSTHRMLRDVDWKQVVFIVAGVPALALFSMGGISATVGAPAWLVWTISVLFGFAQSFTYAEIANLHPSKIEGRRFMAPRRGYATAGFSRPCRYGRIGLPGHRSSPSERGLAPATSCP